jgi:hypothetical protein
MSKKRRSIDAMKMKLLFIIPFFWCVACFAQTKKEKQEYRNARDNGVSNYVIFKSGERKEIRSMKIPSVSGRNGEIVFSDGKKDKFKEGEVIECQTDDGFFKLAKYNKSVSRAFLRGQGLATRKTKGAINIYSLVVGFSYTEGTFGRYGEETIYYLENGNSGNLGMLLNHKNAVDYVESLVAKSKAAMEMITELRNSYGKMRNVGSTEEKLMEAAEQFNRDVAEGKLEK